MPRSCRYLLVLALSTGTVVWSGGPAVRAQQPAAVTFDRYHSPQEINAALAAIARANPSTTALHRVSVSAGGAELRILEIGPEPGKKPRRVPAVFVVANLEGTIPISSEAALHLADLILRKPAAAKDLTWFILPDGNPDAAARFFRKPLLADGRNARKVNDDADDQVDEDGPEDLNGDAVITQMRVKDPAGEWIAVEADPRLMRKADPAKGEKGVYKLYTEGIDNDGDGEYNEDGPGGVNIGVTFPHLFKPFSATSGPWPGSEEETLGILRFVFDHPEIAMTMTFGATNMCLVPPAGGRQGSADLTQVKVPERIATQIGLDPTRTYTIQEIIEVVRPLAPPGFEITESVVAGFLGLGAVVNPLEDDLKVYRELSDRYKEFLKAAKLDAKRLDPAQPADASPELWSYYHLGVPTFSMDFWTLPEAAEEKTEKSGVTADSLETMTSEAFVALGEGKIDAFLKEVGAPPNVKATMLLEGVKAGKMTPKQMAAMVRQMPKPATTGGGDPKMKALVAFSDKELGGKGFVAWTPFKHPQLGDVEIGGPVPFADTTPPASMLKTLLDGQVPWVLTLAERLPRMRILKTDVTAKGAGVYEVNAWVENSGALPFPTAMGKRNEQVPPVVVTLKAEGLTLLSGRTRMPIKDIDAKKSVKLTWLVQAATPMVVDLLLESANAWNDAAQIKLGGAQ
jgi:Zinc carboxypeptidase